MNMKTTRIPKIAIALVSPVLALILPLFLPFNSHAQIGGMAVPATQYTPNTSFPYCCGGNGRFQVALPDKFVKFCIIFGQCSASYPAGRPYTIDFNDFSTYVYGCGVGEVGPWNENDNWWDPPSNWPRPRRKFTDLSQGTPEAFAAVGWGYNGGLSEFGEVITSKPDGPGIDISDVGAAALGWGPKENRWVYISSFNWDFPN